ncbi:MAG: hypothetical protein PHI18_09725 [bacterium]|nr:hypothetical protein [bacterium]
MPIRAENRKRYPRDWKAIRERILGRAKNRCEWCGKPNWQLVEVSPEGWWYDRRAHRWRDEQGKIMGDEAETVKWVRVILTVAHLDHTPENCDPENLRALCQRCHNRYDIKTRVSGRLRRKMEATGTENLKLET